MIHHTLASVSLLVILLTVSLTPAASDDSALLEVSPHSLCMLSSPDGRVTYDLRQLSVAKGYLAQDLAIVKGAAQKDYSYLFNVCQNVTAPSPTCHSGSAPAWQVKPAWSSMNTPLNATECHRLAASPQQAVWSMIDAYDPTKGLSVTYDGGSYCSGAKVNRKFIIHFICGDDFSTGEEIDSTVSEGTVDTTCVYEVEFITSYGCPVQCPYYQKDLCNGGTCGFDKSISEPRCYCQSGLYGRDCSSEVPTSNDCTGVCLFLVFCIVFLTVALAVGACMYWKVSKVIQSNKAMSRSIVGGNTNAASPHGELQLNEPEGNKQRSSSMSGRDDSTGRKEHVEEIELDEEEEDHLDM